MKIPLGSALLLVGAVTGYLTGVNSVGRAGQISAGQWTQWAVNAKGSFALYSIAHFRQQGTLPPSQATRYFTRLLDDEGKSLRGACTYVLSGVQPAARWWSVSAGPAGSGGVDAAFTAGDAVLTSDDQLSMTISRRAAPGNWLAIKDYGAMRVTLVLVEPYPPTKDTTTQLPTLERLGCE